MILGFSKTSDRLKAPTPMSTVLHTMHASINDISSAIIGAAIEVHRILGSGLLESATNNRWRTNSRYGKSPSSGKSRWL
jgi:hypothetical protein